jgi:hypothetical protein
MQIYEIALIILAILIFISALVLLIWLCIEKWVIRPLFLKGIILTSDQSIRIIWLRKSEKKSQKLSMATNRGAAYYYEPKQIRRIGAFYGLVFYENNFHALTFDDKKLEFESHLTMHPKIIKEILDSKLVSEILQAGLTWKDIVLIVTCAACITGFGILIFQGNSHTMLLKSIQGNVSSMPEIMVKICGR